MIIETSLLLSPDEIQARLERILPTIQKPGRYTGGELNQVVKDWGKTRTHIALVFPDLYDLGMSNLGMAILYDQINQRSDTLAERAFSPWIDMETALRKAGIPLYSLESKHPLGCFDIIGFSLPYETLFTNAINALDMAGIPIFASGRNDEHPLIIAGGHATYNPEPMAPFIDAFVIGEGEEVIHEIIDTYDRWKASQKTHLDNNNRQIINKTNPHSSRTDLYRELSHIWGVYVPSLYQAHYKTDGVFSHLEKLVEDAPLPVIKRIVSRLPSPTTRFIVPYIETIHNRIPIEIMRGCTRGCRFCHAGIVNRPVRERPMQEIIDSIEAVMRYTGFEEISLLSLSSSDYSHILELLKAINERFCNRHLGISLPSLRIDTVSVEIMEVVRENRKTGFTLAPEAATERMRQIINKPVSTVQLLETARAIYAHGWTTIKLYFMIGHPSETMEDVQAIADLCHAVLAEGRKILGRRATVHAGVSTFVPKAHTPFQWVSCDMVENIQGKHDLLKRHQRGENLRITWTRPEETMQEAWLARGDRRIADVIYQAWSRGSKFDAWQEHFRYSAWLEAFEAVGLDPSFYTHRVRSLDEIFPWEHISTTIRKKYLIEDYLDSQRGKTHVDCRDHCYACGILPAFIEFRRQTPGAAWRCPEVKPRGKVKPL